MILTFSHIVNGQRVPLLEDGREVTKQVEAPTKTAAMNDPAIIQFCKETGNDTRIRRVM